MGYIQDSGSAIPQPLHQPEKPLGLNFAERRRRFIHDQDTKFTRECTCNLNELLISNGEAGSGPFSSAVAAWA